MCTYMCTYMSNVHDMYSGGIRVTIRMRHSRELTKTRTLSPQKIFYLLCVVSNWKVLHLVSLVHKMFHRLFHASCMWLCTCFQLLLVLKMPRNQTMHFLSVWVPLRYACLQLCHGYACLQLCLPAGSRSRGLSPTCFCGLGGGGARRMLFYRGTCSSSSSFKSSKLFKECPFFY